MSKIWFFVLECLPHRFVNYLCEYSYWRGWNDGRIVGKKVDVTEMLKDDYWRARVTESGETAMKSLAETVEIGAS